MRQLVVCFAAAGLCAAAAAPAAKNLVKNGSFEIDADGDAAPDGWKTSGAKGIVQRLTLDPRGKVGRAAKLTCSHFVPGSPASHAMICQVGVVPIRRGQFYRLSFWAKGRGMKPPIVSVAVRNTRPWSDTGVSGTFSPSPEWKRFVMTCRAKRDAPAKTSRLQIWFGSTGELWLDDVVLERVQMRQTRQPEIATRGVRNLIPNSSFECGAAGWGSYSSSIRTWGGNVFRLLGEIDRTTAFHGQCSLRMRLPAGERPTFYFDYFDPQRFPLNEVETGHVGWIPTRPREPYVLSCWVKADADGTPVVLAAHFDRRGRAVKTFEAGRAWRRVVFPFAARGDYLWVSVGVDLSRSSLKSATLWIDAVQLERGKTASPYAPREAVESFIDTPALGNVFTNPAQGLAARIAACNAGDAPAVVRGRLEATDFFDRPAGSWSVRLRVAAHSRGERTLTGLLAGRRGFFRVRWKPEGAASPYPLSLRCALIEPYEYDDSPFGMNHAYPWAFLLRLAKRAGLTAMRDWSVKWHTVEPRAGAFDFAEADAQIDRVLEANLRVLLMFPFPSAPWCSTVDMKKIEQQAGKNAARRRRLVVAFAPNDMAAFRRYIRRSVEHYRGRIRWYEVFNEPLFTTYALPARFGYQMDDYLKYLQAASETIRAAQPDAKVVGGVDIWPGRRYAQEFIRFGGLQWVDVMTLHQYPYTVPPESYEEGLVGLRRLMKERGQVKPMWLTEYGCYADDDPYLTPSVIGDAVMSRCNWPSERAASEALVKMAAVYGAWGVQKVFFHAGVCGSLNGRSGAGVFFEYGGAPRKMYAALAALADALGPAPQPLLPPLSRGAVRAYAFRTRAGAVAIAWREHGRRPLQLPKGAAARDIMGNRIAPSDAALSPTPIYVLARDAAALRRVFSPRGGK